MEAEKITLTISKTFQQEQFEPICVELTTTVSVHGDFHACVDEVFLETAKALKRQLKEIDGYKG